MTGWILLAAIVLLLLLVCLTPVGIYAAYNGGEFLLRLLLGPWHVDLYPPKDKQKKRAQKKVAKETPEKTEPKMKRPNREQIRYALHVLPPLLKKAVGRTRRRILVSPLRCQVVFAGEDPADVAILYGRCQALTAALLPLVEETVTVRHRDIRLETDFQGERTAISGRVGARLRVWDGLVLLGTLAAGGISWLRGYRRLGRASPTDGKQTDTAAAAS